MRLKREHTLTIINHMRAILEWAADQSQIQHLITNLDYIDDLLNKFSKSGTEDVKIDDSYMASLLYDYINYLGAVTICKNEQQQDAVREMLDNLLQPYVNQKALIEAFDAADYPTLMALHKTLQSPRLAFYPNLQHMQTRITSFISSAKLDQEQMAIAVFSMLATMKHKENADLAEVGPFLTLLNDPNVRNPSDFFRTPLHLILSLNNVYKSATIIRQFIAMGADCAILDYLGHSALFYAQNNADLIKLVLNNSSLTVLQMEAIFSDSMEAILSDSLDAHLQSTRLCTALMTALIANPQWHNYELIFTHIINGNSQAPLIPFLEDPQALLISFLIICFEQGRDLYSTLDACKTHIPDFATVFAPIIAQLHANIYIQDNEVLLRFVLNLYEYFTKDPVLCAQINASFDTKRLRYTEKRLSYFPDLGITKEALDMAIRNNNIAFMVMILKIIQINNRFLMENQFTSTPAAAEGHLLRAAILQLVRSGVDSTAIETQLQKTYLVNNLPMLYLPNKLSDKIPYFMLSFDAQLLRDIHAIKENAAHIRKKLTASAATIQFSSKTALPVYLSEDNTSAGADLPQPLLKSWSPQLPDV